MTHSADKIVTIQLTSAYKNFLSGEILQYRVSSSNEGTYVVTRVDESDENGVVVSLGDLSYRILRITPTS